MKSLKCLTAQKGKDAGIFCDLTEIELKHLQNVLFDMLLDVKSACEKMGIQFTLMGGSALGAVRHKGFIPWDDDIDIAISRKEWEKFKEQFENYFDTNKYILEAPNYKDRDTKYPLAKLFLKNSEYVWIEEFNWPYPNGIYVDVFIIDNVSDNKIMQRIDAIIADFMRVVATSMNEFRYPNDQMKKLMRSTFPTAVYYFIRRTLGFFFSFISHKKWCSWFDNFISRHPDTTKFTTVATGLKRYKREILSREIWFPYSKGEFCGVEFNLPHKQHEYLTEVYGPDYMQLPPVEKREAHLISKLTFPK